MMSSGAHRSILLTNASSIYAGGEYYVLVLATTLISRGHRVIVSCRPDNLLAEKCAANSVPVAPVGFPERGKLLENVRRLKEIVRKENIDIVHTNTNYDRTAGALAARLGGARHVANVHSYHSISHNLTHRIRNRYWTDSFIALGEGAKEILIRDGIPAGKIDIVRLGLDPDANVRSPELGARVRAEFGIGDEDILVGNVGRLVPFKGQEYLLRSFATLTPRHPAARLMIVGDGELDGALRRQAAALSLGDRVIFTGFRDDIPSLYSAMDVYAHSSVEGGGETFPFAVLQALAYGLPTVVTNVGEVGAMVEEGVTGFAVRDRDEEAFAGALGRFLSDAALRESMGRKGRELMMRRFTSEVMASAVEDVYRRTDPAPRP